MPETFNASELLARVDHDLDFLRETVDMLTADGPGLLADVRRAADAGDAAQVARAAHALKGMVANFCAADAIEGALAVERIGRAGQLAPLPPAIEALQARVERLIAELHHFVGEEAS